MVIGRIRVARERGPRYLHLQSMAASGRRVALDQGVEPGRNRLLGEGSVALRTAEDGWCGAKDGALDACVEPRSAGRSE